MIDASVIIVSRDRKELLEKAIDALIAQNYPSEKYELIIVDDGSKQDLKKLCDEKRKKFKNIKYLKQSPSGPVVGRNFGIKNSESDLILFTDNDCIPDKNWIKEMISHFSDKSILGVEGTVTTDKPRKIFHNAPETLIGGHFMTANMGFRKSVLEEIGGFYEKYVFWREDSDLAFRVIDKGKLIFSKKAIVHHPPRKEPPQSMLRILWFMKNDCILFFRQPAKYLKYFGKEFLKNTVKSITVLGLFVFLIIVFLKPNFLNFYEFSIYLFFISFYILLNFILVSKSYKNPNLIELALFLILITLKDFLFIPASFIGFFRAIHAVILK